MATLDKQVAASSDDCRVRYVNGAWELDLTATRASVGYFDATNLQHGSAFRFLNITIPKGATITAAYITITCRTARSATTVNTKIKGEDADSPAAFSDYTDYSGRPRTTAVVNWNNIGAWVVDTEYNSPEIKTIIQEIIDRAGWSSGNNMVIFWNDHDDLSTHAADVNRIGNSYNGSTAKAPKLHIEHTVAAVGRSRGYIIG